MQQQYTLQLKPSEAANETIIREYIAQSSGKPFEQISGYHLLKRSIDARSRQQVWINLTVHAFINEPFHPRKITPISFKDVANSTKKVIIIGAGPAGLFAALKLIEAGICPIILERGKDVRSRRRDLAKLNKEGIVDPESNYCFGEGGAGTYSDGKLYTRSTKRGDINRILNLLHQFGASESVLYDAHPHIGTNKLPHIITAMREQIRNSGGQFLFEKKVVDFIFEKEKIKAVQTADGDTIAADACILATGHSARDIFRLLYDKKIHIEAKPFALGARIEHPQALIDSIQYHCPIRDEFLPPASYGLVEQVNKRGVFSFCMCPGGIIAPAATSAGELVVNGWSPSKRNNPYANSGMVVQVEQHDAIQFFEQRKWVLPDGTTIKKNTAVQNDPLLLMYFQQAVEQSSFQAGGGHFVAPAQRMVDFCSGKTSTNLPDCSYVPGLSATALEQVLPDFIYKSLQGGFQAFGKKMRGYFTNDAVVVATESRTSSPVRIPRDMNTLTHPQINNFYPCGEGAGYAGGIVSAAMDGERVADQIIKKQGY
ncbi:MAG: FAD-dependent oxidoreductase [Chitinophagaceae bacterium]|nr:FAD-dependent oxidoreductase [Chitinophagaceae bacterium]